MADGLMANPYNSLLNLGLSPEQAQAEVDRQRALQFANLNPQQRVASGIYQGITQIGRALGARDPMLEQASQMRQMASQFDTTTAEGMMQYARALQNMGNVQAAQAAVTQAQQMLLREEQLGETRAKSQKARAEAAKLEEEEGRRKRLEEELAKLPEDATEAQMLAVYRKFAKPETALTAIERGVQAKQQQQARIDQLTLQGQQRLDQIAQQGQNNMLIAQQNNASRETIAALARQTQQLIAQARIDTQYAIAGLKDATKPPDDKAAAQASAIIGNQAIIDEGQTLLDKIAPAGQPKREVFGLVSRGVSLLSAGVGKDTEAGRLQSDVKSYLNRARNAYLLASKGVQTDKDAERAWEQFSGTLDFTTAEGVTSSIKRVSEELQRQQQGSRAYLEYRGLPVPGAKKPPAGGQDQFVKGQIYTDKNGNRAEYLGNGQWKEL